MRSKKGACARQVPFYIPRLLAGILDICLRGPFGAMPHRLSVKKGPAQGRSPFLFPRSLAGILDVCLRRGKSRDVKERFACANRSFSARIPYLRGFLIFACATITVPSAVAKLSKIPPFSRKIPRHDFHLMPFLHQL